MKDELTRQCEMAWKRGFELGIATSIIANLLLTLVVVILSIVIAK